ncbi:hypothetical protein [Halorubrum sp. DTA98]|uniref:hypothetical protein n=1 Tax=Halorubrum sp. DTA98 TaxID=3402163 RepID=UPI003AAB4DF1
MRARDLSPNPPGQVIMVDAERSAACQGGVCTRDGRRVRVREETTVETNLCRKHRKEFLGVSS